MKSIQRRFNDITEKNPYWSSHTSFAMAIMKQKFSRKSLHYWFNKLVEKADYAKSEKQEVMLYLEEL